MRNRPFSIRLVSCFLLIIVLIIFLTTVVTLQKLGDILRDNYDSTSALAMDILEKSIQDTLFSYEKIAQNILGNDGLNRLLLSGNEDERLLHEGVVGHLAIQVFNNPYIQSITVNCVDGRRYVCSREYNQNTVNFLSNVDHRTRGDEARRYGRSAWVYLPAGDPDRRPPDQISRIALLGTIKDREYPYLNEIIATFVIEININIIHLLYSNAHLPGSSTVGIIDSAGRLFPVSGVGPDVSKLVPDAADSGSGDAPLSLVGEDVYKIRFSPIKGTDWMLYSAVNEQDVSDQIRTLTIYFYGIAAAVFCISLVLAVSLSLGISRPIKVLIQNMDRIKQGDFSNIIDIKRNDEFGRLNESFNQMTIRLDKLIREVSEVRVSEKEAQILAMQAQINPHFLYNTLDLINWTVTLGEAQNASDMITSLSNMLRYSISANHKNVTVDEEILHIRHYLHIFGYRLAGDLEYSIDIDEDILGCGVFKFFLQPLVENAIIHGIHGSGKKGVIHISGRRDGYMMRFCVRDNGVGIDPNRIPSLLSADTEEKPVQGQRTSIGIPHVVQRIRLIYGDEPYGVSIESVPGEGTTVHVCIPADL